MSRPLRRSSALAAALAALCGLAAVSGDPVKCGDANCVEFCPPIIDADLIDRATSDSGDLSELLQYVCREDPITSDCGVSKECVNCQDIPTLLDLVAAEGEDVDGAMMALKFLCHPCNAPIQEAIIHLDTNPKTPIDADVAFASICGKDECYSEYEGIASKFEAASSAAAASDPSKQDTMTIFHSLQDGCHKKKKEDVADAIRHLMLAVTGDLKTQVPALTESVGFLSEEPAAAGRGAPAARGGVDPRILQAGAVVCLVTGAVLLVAAASVQRDDEKKPELL